MRQKLRKSSPSLNSLLPSFQCLPSTFGAIIIKFLLPNLTTRFVVAALAAAVATPGNGQTLVGDASAADGDSLTLGGQRVRLFGIDAPELDQTCEKDGAAWSCGAAAKAQLAQLVSGQRVECRGQGADQYGRTLAVCSVGYGEINRIMVEQGWALAYRQYSEAYIAEELRAKTGRRGIWASNFVRPSEYRQAKMPAAPQRSFPPPANPARTYRSQPGCAIKGNRNRHGEWIYHLPGMPYYEQTRPEDLFCTEAQAQAAGYRRAIVRP